MFLTDTSSFILPLIVARIVFREKKKTVALTLNTKLIFRLGGKPTLKKGKILTHFKIFSILATARLNFKGIGNWDRDFT